MASKFDSSKSPLERLETQAQLAFIRKVFEKKLPVRLWGGYADDALLSERVSRLHHDVDLTAMRSDMELLKQELGTLGYSVTEESFGKRDKPYKLLVKGKNVLADVALFDSDERGDPIIDIFYAKIGRRYQVSFDDKMFQANECKIEGVPVVVVSPLALIRSKDAYFQARVARSRTKDVAGKAALLAKFFPDSDPRSEQFKLRIKQT